MSQLVGLAKRMEELKAVADVHIVNVDTPENSRQLKATTGVTVPVLLDVGLQVSKAYDMHARPGVPMGGMKGFPAMGFVIVDGAGVIRMQRSHLYFGTDADLMLRTIQSL